MHSNRERADIEAYVRNHGRQQGWNAVECEAAVTRLTGISDCMRQLRRAVESWRRAGPNDAAVQRAVAQTFDAFRAWVVQFGPLRLRLHHADVRTMEGWTLPRNEADVEQPPLACLYRDGLVGLQFQPELIPDELRSLIGLLANWGKREGDDASTWLLSLGLRSIRAEFSPPMPGRLAGTLAAELPGELRCVAYAAVLNAARGAAQPSDSRHAITVAHADDLQEFGLSRESVHRLLSEGPDAVGLTRPSATLTDSYRASYADPGLRALRVHR